MPNKCIICGKSFEPYRRNQKCCSDACRREHFRRYALEAAHSMSDNQIYQCKIRKRKSIQGRTICRICGKPIIRDYFRDNEKTRFHEDCIINDCMKTYPKISHTQYLRLYNLGYTLKTFKEEFIS